MKSIRRWVLTSMLALTIVVGGCSRKDESAAAVGTSAIVTASAAPTSSPSAESAVSAVATASVVGFGSAQAAVPLQVAFASGGHGAEGGWTAAHDRGRLEMESALGGEIRTVFLEDVPEGAAAGQMLRELATQGAKLIFGTAAGLGDAMAVLARDFPEVKWEQASGTALADNLRGYDIRAYQGAYLAGIVAGKLTRTDTLGFVASMPVSAVVRNINAFTLGAQSVNPSARTKVVWVNKAFDPGRESEAAQSLIKGGADVLLQSTDSPAPIRVAEKAGKYAFGWGSDMSSFGPKAHLGAVVADWGPYYIRAAREVLDGTWKPQLTWSGLAQGAIDLVGLSNAVPQEVKELVEEKRKAIADGSFRIWKGPMISSEDREVLATGIIGDDRFIRSIMFLVKGVEGTIPPAN